MKDNSKAQQLKRHKQLATGLFVLMLIVYLVSTYFSKMVHAGYIGYIRAFSEAAMVGALADWFAVTALFHHPLGIPIPHTNLIEKSKQNIGNNLGDFVVSNFLTQENLRPYMQKLKLSAYAANWLSKERNKQLLLNEIAYLLIDIIENADDKTIIDFMVKKGSGLVNEIDLNGITSKAFIYFLDKGDHEKLVSFLAARIKQFIEANNELVREKVSEESFFFIPKFVERKLADKISNGLIEFLTDLETDPQHSVRHEITGQLYNLANAIKTDPEWTNTFQGLKNKMLTEEQLHQYAADGWNAIKATIQQELKQAGSATMKYISKTLEDLTGRVSSDKNLQAKIDGWIQVNAYKYILRNKNELGNLISNTVGNWEGRALSEKLELEVGKDLQFIRINGTIVGGLVGLLIHTLTTLLM